ncbi:CaiB/BaiF CoA-transferase family protein [Noviherbaspirillum aerium]|uniref:CaiB/BaiF CoA-transferase family protein n=1 Tax=Noviherbaspirillum aerium TaxID=2588497 RepID=UPI001CEF7FA3|nr:CoA transferase [Noviherbaspirillum aerium]
MKTIAHGASLPREMVFSSIRVLEVGYGPALAYAGKLFADFGAEVIKVEPPEGDPWRRMPPLLNPESAASDSALFAWLNTNKRSVTADLSSELEWLHTLAATCDIVLDARALGEGGKIQSAPELGEPGLPEQVPVTVELTWFGEDGQYSRFRGTESVCRSLAGAVHGSGPIDGPPHMPHDIQTGIVAGLSAFTTATAAWIGREHGSRRFVLSIHEAVLGVVEMEAGMVQDNRHPLKRLGVNRFCGTHPSGIYETADGWLGLFTHTLPQWKGLCLAIGHPELGNDPRYCSGPDRMSRADEVDALLIPALRTRTASEWFSILGNLKHPAVFVPTMEELLQQEVHRQRGAFVSVAVEGTHFKAPIVPFRLDDLGPLKGGRAATLGEHNTEYKDGLQGTPVRNMPAAPGDTLPLAGLRVLDLTMGWAGPLATRTLADLGAEVIKVESISYPDWWRGTNFTDEFYQEHLYEKNNNFNLMNRNKLGITLDLTSPEGKRLLLSLASRCDAVVENFSAEVLPKLGLDYEAMRAVNPKLVMLSMPAFGLGNAWSDTRAYGGTLEQASGLPLYTGHPEYPPAMTSYAYGDPIGGMNGGAALLLALIAQRRNGQGLHVNLSQVEAMLPMTAPFLIAQSVHGSVAQRQGNRHPVHVPHGCYRCAGEDSWIVVSVINDDDWRTLCNVMGRGDLAGDEQLATATGRQARQMELDVVLQAWTEKQDVELVMNTLQAAGIAAGAVRSMGQVLTDPHLQSRSFWQPLKRDFVKQYLSTSTPYRQGKRPMPIRLAAPTLGQHTDAVLGDLLGLDASDIAKLERQGVIGTQAQRKATRTAR